MVWEIKTGKAPIKCNNKIRNKNWQNINKI